MFWLIPTLPSLLAHLSKRTVFTLVGFLCGIGLRRDFSQRMRTRFKPCSRIAAFEFELWMMLFSCGHKATKVSPPCRPTGRLHQSLSCALQSASGSGGWHRGAACTKMMSEGGSNRLHRLVI